MHYQHDGSIHSHDLHTAAVVCSLLLASTLLEGCASRAIPPQDFNVTTYNNDNSFASPNYFCIEDMIC